jgi:glycosyltransferase involved in cell wall biosynthesis
MRKMIWMFNHYAMTPAQGAFTRQYMFAEHLKQKGYNCRIFASSAIHNTGINMIKSKKRYQEMDQYGRDFTYIRTRDYTNRISRILNLLDYFFGLLSVSREYKKPDVIYISMPHILTGLAGIIVAKRLKVKCVLEVRDLWPESIVQYKVTNKYNPIIPLLYILEKWLYVNADKVIFTMEGGMDYIRDKGWDKKISSSKVSSINNGCELQHIRKNEMDFIYECKELGDFSTFKVIYTGSIRHVNNLRIVMDCAKILKDNGNEDIVFLVFGEGDQKNALIAYCRDKGIDNVFFKDYVDKKYIPGILKRADIGLLHSISNPLFKYGYSPNKLFDYLACGKPILSDISCNPKFDILLRYGCGITVVGNDAGALAEGVLAFHDMPKEERDAYGRRAEAAAQAYDYNKLTSLLEKALFQE